MILRIWSGITTNASNAIPRGEGPLPFAGDVQGGQVTLGDAAAEPLVYEVGDAAEKALAGVVAEASVARVGVQHAEVARCVVRFVPAVVSGRLYLEQARVLDLRGPVRNLLELGRPFVVFGMDDLGRFALVDYLHLLEETPVGVRVYVHVPERGEGSSLSERVRDPGVGDLGIEPVKGGGRYGQVEDLFLWPPLLEGSHVHFRSRVRPEVAAGECGQVFPELDAEYAVAALGEGHRSLARAAPDLEYVPPRRYSGERDHVVE